MTRAEAIEAVSRLALGLPPGDVESKAARLMERISADPRADVLRDALVEVGARAVLARKGGIS